MPTYLVNLAEPLPESLGDELAKRIYYLADGIDAFALVRSEDRVTGVEITTRADADPAGLARRLDHVSRTEVRPQRLTAAAPLWTSPHPPAASSGTFERLRELGAVHEMGPGAVATGRLFSEVLDALDAGVLALATDAFGAEEFRYPALISTAALHKGGYLTSFPQFAMTASCVSSDLDVYRAFVDGMAAAAEPSAGAPPSEDADSPAAVIDRYSRHSGYCLPPTMCFHTYLQLAGRPLPAGGAVVTSRGKSFRFESRYSRSLERLWDFTIREIVFLGDTDTVARRRADFLTAACGYVGELGLAGWVEPASDPFFAAPTVPRRLLAQRLTAAKYELRLPVDDGRSVAAASFNVHGTTFGESYRITLPNGTTAGTACVGFGLERLAFAFFCRHGTDPTGWPAALRARLPS
ncbi:hypothetical protein SAMN05216223_101702 [Actinacidiphila yanglinensis]|uniref:Aminoacyl-transfer RNA synthetases class-II family profile domain-containing protein n=1 Tax=Actinacidiphila yanglinensis TaxID=310779 RepID=A0A1H5TYU1_9ACTN|nr:hypothetical protein [Actinacidiphila yanglinensis]SEF67953.1 hypothetical protein SAMN05216223_101702 [Actinacidiphila yanglinensis]